MSDFLSFQLVVPQQRLHVVVIVTAPHPANVIPVVAPAPHNPATQAARAQTLPAEDLMIAWIPVYAVGYLAISVAQAQMTFCHLIHKK